MKHLVALVCAMSVVAASCSSATDAATPPPSSSPAADATVAPTDARRLVEGEDFEVVTMLPGDVDGAQALWFGVDEDGTAYGEVLTPGPPVDPGSMGQLGTYAQPVLMSPAGALTRMTPVRDSGEATQMTGADADERWVTWLESASGSIGSGLWTLFSYERSTKQVRQLGSYRDHAAWKETGIDYDGRPEIVGDTVLMGMEVWDRSAKGSAVLRAPLDGSAPLDVHVADATAPDVDEDGFSHLRLDGTLMHHDDATGRSREIDAPTEQGACQQYQSGVLLTCDLTAGGVLVTIAGPDGETVYGPFPEAVTYADIEAGWARFVANQGLDPKVYLVRLSDRRLYEVSDWENDWTLMGNGFAAIVKGRKEITKEPGQPTAEGYQLVTLR